MKYLFWLLLLVTHYANAELLTHSADSVLMPLEREFDGTVSAVRQATVSAQTSAQVQDLLVDVGDNVQPGTVILRLVSTELKETLKQAEAMLEETRANLEAETVDFERKQALLERRLIAKADFDQSKARFSSAKAKLASAEAAIKAAKQRLSYTEVRAPYGGIVSARHVELGEAVSPGMALISGFDPNALRIEVAIPQAAAQAVRQWQRVRVIADSDRVVIPSQIILFPVADPATSTIRVRLTLPEKATGLYPGQFVKVAFTVGETERLLVPKSSIVYRSEVSGVYVIGAEKLQLRQIRVGSEFADNIEVLAGLVVGEQIALDPVAAGIMLHNSVQDQL